MNVRFLTIAQQEVDEAVVWFEERAQGKGIDFLDELDRVVRLVKAFLSRHLKLRRRFDDVYLRAFRTRWYTESITTRSSSLLWHTLIVHPATGLTV